MFESDETGEAAIGHGYTYSGHPVGAAAALACLAETKRLNVPENAAARGAELFAGLQALQEKYDADRRRARRPRADVRARTGLGPRRPRRRSTRRPSARVQEVAYRAGAMVRVSGPNIILSPPLVLTADDVQTILAALDAGFAAL